MKRTAVLVSLLAICGIFAATPSQAQWQFGLRTGVYTDDSDLFLGAEFVTPMGPGPWKFNPNFEWAFVDNGDLWTLNADFTFDLAPTGAVDLWVGGGPALVVRNRDRGDDETDPGLNLLAGVGFLRGRAVSPYFLAKILVSDNSQAILGFGVRF